MIEPEAPVQMLVQVAKPASPAIAGVSLDPAVIQVQALATQEVESVQNLMRLEGQKVALESELKSSPGAVEREQLERQLRVTNAQIDGTRASIERIKEQIKAARSEQSVGIAVVAPAAPAEHRMFNLTKDEFTGAFAFVMLFPMVMTAMWLLIRRPARRSQTSLEDSQRLARLEQAIESVAIEVERISESQRYQAKLMAEKQSVTP